MTGTTGLLVMAYGTASGPDDIERYYTDIRGGRPPSPEHLEGLRRRYEAIGNRFELLDMTAVQTAALETALNESGGDFVAYQGMKHSAPFIPETVARMREDRIERAVGIVMAPHWAQLSVEAYIARVEKEVAEHGGPAFAFVRDWYSDPAFVAFLGTRVRDAMAELPEDVRDKAAVIFSAHSLPIATAEDGQDRCIRCTADRCRQRCEYHFELQDTADRVADAIDLVNDYSIAWQSAGRTADLWWGPPVENVIPARAADGYPGVVVCCAGFAAEHLETLYDLDIEAREIAEEAGVAFARTAMPNDDPRFIEALAGIVENHAKEQAG